MAPPSLMPLAIQPSSRLLNQVKPAPWPPMLTLQLLTPRNPQAARAQQSIRLTPSKKATLPSGFRMLADTPALPWPIPTMTAIWISSSVTKTATPSSSAIPVHPPLPLTPNKKATTPSGLCRSGRTLANGPSRPLPMPMATATLISSSPTPAGMPLSSVTPQIQAPPLPPIPNKRKPRPSGFLISAAGPNRPLPISTMTAIWISSSATAEAIPAFSATPQL